MRKFFFVLLFFVGGNFLFAQTLPGKFGFGADLGITILQGQSKPYVQPLGSAHVRWGVFDFLSINGKFSGGWVGFRDKDTNVKNWTTIISGEIQPEFHIVPRSRSDAYFFISAGMIHYQPNINSYMGKNTPTVGFGLGLNMYVRHFLSVDFSASYNLTTRGDFDGNPNTKDKDGFIALKLGLTYYFYDKEYIRQAYIRGKRAR
ncbi:hypothetical protein [Candidatus Chrysopegis kryptomonas]|uniref:Outer membrane protein beta-barrel domain-containing protein n=1 Tax=Candidatus Chryseopegocella kryptomonas TaxID=1633643 RepID=A0A0P1MKT2_9BACT|nr:hypothetical protein [Candidatus Chrysopegis kryptomonas]CUS96012.1 hypothetical protein JGI23_00039 [Candidatus Chrysopegis kryptomonas]